MSQFTSIAIYQCIAELNLCGKLTAGTDFMSGANELHIAVSGAKHDINRVVIRSELNDTYVMTFYRFRRLEMTVIDTVRGIFGDRLVSVFKSRTGLKPPNDKDGAAGKICTQSDSTEIASKAT